MIYRKRHENALSMIYFVCQADLPFLFRSIATWTTRRLPAHVVFCGWRISLSLKNVYDRRLTAKPTARSAVGVAARRRKDHVMTIDVYYGW